MKKFAAVLCVCLMAGLLSGCQAFYGTKTTTANAEDPYQTTVYLQVNSMFNFSLGRVQAWLGEIERQITENQASQETKITAVKLRNVTNGKIDLTDTYTVELTLSNVPGTVTERTNRPFKIHIRQTLYNPIEILPETDVFTYVVGYTTTRAPHAVNTQRALEQSDGTHVYLWDTQDPIVFEYVYPNRPLYYLLVLGGAVVVGVVVYLICRYNDCKKRKNSL